MTLSIANIGASANPDINSSTDLSSYTNTSWTPSGDMVMCFVYNRVGAGIPNEPTISGNSLTWLSIKTVTASLHRMTLFAAATTGTTAGITTIDLDGQAQQALCASFLSATDCHLVDGVANAFAQSPTNSGAAASGTVVLAAASAPNNLAVAAHGHLANEVTTTPATWTLLDELDGTSSNRGMRSMTRNPTETTNASGTWATSIAWVGVAAEVKETIVSEVKYPFRRTVKSQARHRASRW